MVTIIKSRETEDNNICGIVYAHSLDDSPVNKKVWEQFNKQRSRGVEGFGFFDGKYITKAAIEKRIKHKLLRSDKNKSNMILFHHRFPTSTVNEKKAAHPFNTGSFFGNTRYILVHNGVIYNPNPLKEAHEKLGIKYQSVLKNGKFNDSESLLWDFALTMEGKQDKMKAYGGIAFICIRIKNGRPDKMFFGRNTGRPLKLKKDKQGIMLSSEGEGEETKTHTLYTYNYKTKRLSEKFFRVPSIDPKWDTDKSWDSKFSNYRIPTTVSSSNSSSNNACGYNPSADYEEEYQDEFGRFSPETEVYYDEDGRSYVVHEGGLLYDDGAFEYWDEELEQMVTVKYNERKSGELESIKSIMERNNPLEPTQEEIETRIWDALKAAEGNYSQAYWSMERRYDDIDVTEPKNYLMRKEIRLLGKAIDEFTTRYSMFDTDAIHPSFKKMEKTKAGIWVTRQQLTLAGV